MNEFDENRNNIIPDDPATPEDGIPGGEPVTESEVSGAEQDDSIASIEKIAAEFSAEEAPEEMDMEEAALVARTLAKAMVVAEQRAAQKQAAGLES